MTARKSVFGDKDAQYRKDYRAGWEASKRVGRTGNPSRKYEDGSYTWAWEDGYLDYATDREYGHLATCTDHDNCP